MTTLKDVLPAEFTQDHETPAFRHRDVAVVAAYSTSWRPDGTRDWKPWPGKHRNVQNWYVLANGRAVGWNEGPQGWSFPVIRYRQTTDGRRIANCHMTRISLRRDCAGLYTATLGDHEVTITKFSRTEGAGFDGWVAQSAWDRLLYTDALPTKRDAVREAGEMLRERAA